MRLYPTRPTKELSRRLARTVQQVFAQAAKLGLRKSAAYMAGPEPSVLRRDSSIGVLHRFPPGHVPANKGLRRPGYAPGRMAETQFKKGQRTWNWMPIGSLRTNADGYLDRKISDTGYPPRDWVGEHILLWRAAHGPVPPGYALKFKDGNRRNVALDNLELISRAELMRRNIIHRLPEDLKKTIQQLGALRRAINRQEKKRHEEQDHRPSQPPV